MRSAFVVGRRNRRTTTLYLLQLIRTPIAVARGSVICP